MSFLNRLFTRDRPSKEIAKERLQLVLVHDRQPLSPELLRMIKDEIIVVISKHVDIDRENTEVTLSRGRGYQKLIADIPIRNPRRKH
jgi:cell division topological specificity factor